jgi:hypothetical protein
MPLQVDRSKTPWIIFAGHRPFYIDSTNDDYPVSLHARLRFNVNNPPSPA